MLKIKQDVPWLWPVLSCYSLESGTQTSERLILER